MISMFHMHTCVENASNIFTLSTLFSYPPTYSSSFPLIWPPVLHCLFIVQ
jgi:hypothetical protein